MSKLSAEQRKRFDHLIKDPAYVASVKRRAHRELYGKSTTPYVIAGLGVGLLALLLAARH